MPVLGLRSQITCNTQNMSSNLFSFSTLSSRSSSSTRTTRIVFQSGLTKRSRSDTSKDAFSSTSLLWEFCPQTCSFRAWSRKGTWRWPISSECLDWRERLLSSKFRVSKKCWRLSTGTRCWKLWKRWKIKQEKSTNGPLTTTKSWHRSLWCTPSKFSG